MYLVEVVTARFVLCAQLSRHAHRQLDRQHQQEARVAQDLQNENAKIGNGERTLLSNPSV